MSRALPEHQKASSGLIHIPLTSEEGLVLVSEAQKDTSADPSVLKGKVGELSVFLCLWGLGVKRPQACS